MNLDSQLSGETTLLIVDDNRDMTENLCEIFTDLGYRTHSAFDLRGGLKQVRQVRPDVVVVDKNLPDGNGLSLIKPLHETCPLSACIVLTGYPSLESAMGALNAGAYSYLLKGAAVEEYVATVNRAVERVSLAKSKHALEGKLRQTERLAAIGALAARVAHEVRNPLAGIAGAVQVLGRRVGDSPEATETISDILNEVRRLDGFVKDLLLFARPVQAQRLVVSLTDLVERTLSLLSNHPGFRHMEVEVDVLADSDEIYVDPHLFHLVFQNLFLNAAQAQKLTGQIMVRLKTDPEGNRKLEVEDDGPGIRAEVKDHLFEPFHSTKSLGTGLGLSTVKKVLESHKATITVANNPSGGAIFTMLLPHVANQTSAA